MLGLVQVLPRGFRHIVNEASRVVGPPTGQGQLLGKELAHGPK